MKIAYLVFMLICWAALIQGTSYGAQPQAASQQPSRSPADIAETHPNDMQSAAPTADTKYRTSGRPADEKPDYRHVAEQNQALSRGSLTRANRAKQLPNSKRKPSTAGDPMHLRQPGSAKPGAVVNGRLIQNETVSSVVRARSPSVLRPSVQLPGDVRHRGPNSAVIGGSANSKTGNSGAINGTRMNRRH